MKIVCVFLFFWTSSSFTTKEENQLIAFQIIFLKKKTNKAFDVVVIKTRHLDPRLLLAPRSLLSPLPLSLFPQSRLPRIEEHCQT